MQLAVQKIQHIVGIYGRQHLRISWAAPIAAVPVRYRRSPHQLRVCFHIHRCWPQPMAYLQMKCLGKHHLSRGQVMNLRFIPHPDGLMKLEIEGSGVG